MMTGVFAMCNNRNINAVMTTDFMQYNLAMVNNIPAIYFGIKETSYYISDNLSNSFLEYIADNVLIVVSKYNLIFDTAFLIYKKILENGTINHGNCKIYYYNNTFDNYELHNKLYNIFQEKFSKFKNKNA